MFYRVCLTFVPQVYVLDNPLKWQHGQVHAEYPKASGSLAPLIDSLMSTMLGSCAPNLSVVIERITYPGCYKSIRENQSDLTPILTGYPIHDFARVNPV